jgi:hypothetical protein
MNIGGYYPPNNLFLCFFSFCFSVMSCSDISLAVVISVLVT